MCFNQIKGRVRTRIVVVVVVAVVVAAVVVVAKYSYSKKVV